MPAFSGISWMRTAPCLNIFKNIHPSDCEKIGAHNRRSITFDRKRKCNMATATMKLRRSITRPFVVWLLILSAFLLVGIYAMIQVLLKGLQLTGLSDQVPWGLWITHDLSGIALGAGAFTFSAAVYLFRIKRLEPLARAAVFIGFLGYSSAMIALAMDIGRPDRFWHPLVYWNVHSVF